MRRIMGVELIIILATLAAVLILTFSLNDVSVEEHHQSVDLTNASQSIAFDLKAGQQVSGSLNYTGDDTGGWFDAYDPVDNHLKENSVTFGNHTVSFAFTVDADGTYYIGIGKNTFYVDYIDYEYTVSPAIFGLSRTALIVVAVGIGALLATLTALKHLRNNRK